MVDDSLAKLVGTRSEYISPSLSLLAPNDRPQTLCVFCPLSRWYKRTHWECFCSEFKSLMFDGSPLIGPVYACDAREIEVVRLNAEQEKE